MAGLQLSASCNDETGIPTRRSTADGRLAIPRVKTRAVAEVV